MNPGDAELVKEQGCPLQVATRSISSERLFLLVPGDALRQKTFHSFCREDNPSRRAVLLAGTLLGPTGSEFTDGDTGIQASEHQLGSCSGVT